MINLDISSKVFNSTYYPYLFDYNNKEEIYYGGAGSGKSMFIAQKLLLKALKYRSRKILVIRKTGVSQKESCWRLFLEILSKWKIREYCTVHISDYTITLPNNSMLLFKGLDDAERIKSIVGITDIWCEEATELNDEEYDQLLLRLRANKQYLQMYVSFNPISKVNWVYRRWFENENHENTFILKTTYKDNRFLPEDYVKSLEDMIETNPTYYKIYALGEFCSLDRLIFNNWEVSSIDERIMENLPILIGLDFGYVNDPSALIVSRVDEKNKLLYVVDEIYEKGLLNNQIADLIKYKGYRKEVIIADSAEQKSIDEIKREGIPRIKGASKGGGSVLQGIQQLQQYHIIVNPSCSNIITELNNYSWKKDKQSSEYVNEPVDSYNHCLDALRYSLQCKQERLQTINKSQLGVW